MNASDLQKPLGARGEAIAAKFLQQNFGFELVQKNFHAQGGELDLVMKNPENDEYVFVEVKTRTNDAFGGGKAAITAAKFEKMLRAIEDFFLKKLQRSDIPEFRIDAVILKIEGTKVFCEHVENIGPDDF
ncbi:YraN family protein [bacterium]|jgi:putative endonuclease|nr:YraN family protein [bacterium]MBT6831723.1 YraN family protein [bacterium]MBT6996546.1 YraN family protein [bacterium]MBT7772872.1 YraN family protein [bacterium]